jgi:hypothetical protein
MSTKHSIAAPAIPETGKHIAYEPATRDYAMYLDGDLIGFARTYHEAETTLDQLAFDLLRRSASERPAGAE